MSNDVIKSARHLVAHLQEVQEGCLKKFLKDANLANARAETVASHRLGEARRILDFLELEG